MFESLRLILKFVEHAGFVKINAEDCNSSISIYCMFFSKELYKNLFELSLIKGSKCVSSITWTVSLRNINLQSGSSLEHSQCRYVEDFFMTEAVIPEGQVKTMSRNKRFLPL